MGFGTNSMQVKVCTTIFWGPPREICYYNKLYIYRERERWVQVTSGVTLESYNLFKLLD